MPPVFALGPPLALGRDELQTLPATPLSVKQDSGINSAMAGLKIFHITDGYQY